MIKADLSLPIGSPPPAGLVPLREDRVAGIVEYTFCAGVGPHHARYLSAHARAINYARPSPAATTRAA
jgi:hypothetical protein